MDAKQPTTPVLRRRIPIYLVLPMLVFTCVCGFALGNIPSANRQSEATRQPVAAIPNAPAASTHLPVVTAASAPTATQTQTATATNTPTQTAQPATQTAVALAAVQTSQSAYRTSTRQAIEAQQTAKARAATSTRDALLAQRTQAAGSTATYQALIGQYQRVNIQDIVSYPGSYEGQKIIVRAEVNEIRDSGAEVTLWLYSWAGSGFITAYLKTPLTPDSGVREGYTYNVYGTVATCPAFVFYDLDGYCLDESFIPANK